MGHAIPALSGSMLVLGGRLLTRIFSPFSLHLSPCLLPHAACLPTCLRNWDCDFRSFQSAQIGLSFQQGRTYLVYTTPGPLKTTLKTGSCARIFWLGPASKGVDSFRYPPSLARSPRPYCDRLVSDIGVHCSRVQIAKWPRPRKPPPRPQDSSNLKWMGPPGVRP